ncbi:MAG: hypothetical protein ACYDIC_08380 [Desulfobaccales bacterium]
MKMRLMPAVLMVGVFLAGTAQAGVVKEVSFAKGSNSALIKGSVIRGESDQYFLTAKAGQKMEVSITALEKNAAFAIYQPGYKAGKDADGILEIKGATLKGAGEGEDATVWKGVLPGSGKYLILVGPTRGNATYQLKIGIH